MKMIGNVPLAAAVCLAIAAHSGCSANGGVPGLGSGQTAILPGDGFDLNGVLLGDGSNADTAFPNDGSVGGVIVNGSTVIAGTNSDPEKSFICSRSASILAGASAEVAANGLVGGALSSLLDSLGASSVTNLLNSVKDKELAIDADLTTAASITQTIAGLGALLGSDAVSSVDLNVKMPVNIVQPSGTFAIFAVSFPPSLINLGLLSTIRVSTLLNDVVQENSVRMDTSSLSLLGLSVAGINYAWVGYKTTKPYDTVRLSFSSDLLSLDVGESMYIHEMCTHGSVVPMVAG